MRYFILFSLFLLLACEGQNKVIDEMPEIGFVYDIYSGETTKYGQPMIRVEDGKYCRINFKANTKDVNADFFEMLEIVNTNVPKEKLLQAINFGLKSSFQLKIGSSTLIPCKMYHAEPFTFNSGGQKMVLFFEIDPILFNSKNLLQAELHFDDFLFNHQNTSMSFELINS